MVAAAAAAQALWQEARALCLKTVLSGRSRAGHSLSLLLLRWMEARYSVKRVGSVCLHSCKDGRSQDAAFSAHCEQGPPSLRFSEQEVGRSSYTLKPGRKRQSCL